MAHSCPYCDQHCHCGGDIDDCQLDGTPEQDACTHCPDGHNSFDFEDDDFDFDGIEDEYPGDTGFNDYATISTHVEWVRPKHYRRPKNMEHMWQKGGCACYIGNNRMTFFSTKTISFVMSKWDDLPF